MGGQGALTHCTLFNEHISLAEQPPLARSQDGSQKASPVGLNTLHLEPVRHLTVLQGSSVGNHSYNRLLIVWGYVLLTHFIITNRTALIRRNDSFYSRWTVREQAQDEL